MSANECEASTRESDIEVQAADDANTSVLNGKGDMFWSNHLCTSANVP